ncbi:MAG: ParB/RepB/Spo0J family partition protein [Sphingobacteriales bacterium]|nr:MAG: ParB/RepB/Spo0J family partition protein [Sphingobacteriales bacterium]
MSKGKEALGKGIRALLDDIDLSLQSPKGQTEKTTVPQGQSFVLPIEGIEVNPFQPRVDFDEQKLTELADSIRIHGVIQPITVRKISGNKYQLIAGERRLKASHMAGIKEIPAFVRIANDQEMLEMALIENTHREDLNSIEVAINYKRLIDECDLKQEELAERVGKDRTTVTNYLRLLKLPPDIQVAIKNKSISMAHARALITIENPLVQLHIFKEAIKNGLSVRQVEQMVRENAAPNKKKSAVVKEPALPYEYKRIQEKLQSHLGTRVSLKRLRGGKGEINISYFSDEDLERIKEIIEGR